MPANCCWAGQLGQRAAELKLLPSDWASAFTEVVSQSTNGQLEEQDKMIILPVISTGQHLETAMKEMPQRPHC